MQRLHKKRKHSSVVMFGFYVRGFSPSRSRFKGDVFARKCGKSDNKEIVGLGSKNALHSQRHPVPLFLLFLCLFSLLFNAWQCPHLSTSQHLSFSCRFFRDALMQKPLAAGGTSHLWSFAVHCFHLTWVLFFNEKILTWCLKVGNKFVWWFCQLRQQSNYVCLRILFIFYKLFFGTLSPFV